MNSGGGRMGGDYSQNFSPHMWNQAYEPFRSNDTPDLTDEAHPWTGFAQEVSRLKAQITRTTDLSRTAALSRAKSKLGSGNGNKGRGASQGPKWLEGAIGGKLSPFSSGQTVLTTEISALYHQNNSQSNVGGNSSDTGHASPSTHNAEGLHKSTPERPDKDYPYQISAGTVDSIVEFVYPTAACNANINALTGFILHPGVVVKHSHYKLKPEFRSMMEDHWQDVVLRAVQSMMMIGIAVGVIGYHDILGQVLRIIHPTQLIVTYGIDLSACHLFRVRDRQSGEVLENTVVFVNEAPLAGGEIQSPMYRMLLPALRLRLTEVLTLHADFRRAVPPLFFSEVPYGTIRGDNKKKPYNPDDEFTSGNDSLHGKKGNGMGNANGSANMGHLVTLPDEVEQKNPLPNSYHSIRGATLGNNDKEPPGVDNFAQRVELGKQRAKVKATGAETSATYEHRMGSDLQEIFVVNQPYAVGSVVQPQTPAAIASLREAFFIDMTAQFGLPSSAVRTQAGAYKPNTQLETRRMYQTATAMAEPLEKRINEVIRLMWGNAQARAIPRDITDWSANGMSGTSAGTGTRAADEQENLRLVFVGRQKLNAHLTSDVDLGIDDALLHTVRHGVAHIMKLSHLIATENEDDPSTQNEHESTIFQGSDKPGGARKEAVSDTVKDIRQREEYAAGGVAPTGSEKKVERSGRESEEASVSRKSTKNEQEGHTKAETKGTNKAVASDAGCERDLPSATAGKASPTKETSRRARHKPGPKAKSSGSRSYSADMKALDVQVDAVVGNIRRKRLENAFWQREIMRQADPDTDGAPTPKMLTDAPVLNRNHRADSTGTHSGANARGRVGTPSPQAPCVDPNVARKARVARMTESIHDDPRHGGSPADTQQHGLYVSLLLMVDSRRMNTLDFTRAQTERSVAFLEYLCAERCMEDVKNGMDPRTVGTMSTSSSSTSDSLMRHDDDDKNDAGSGAREASDASAASRGQTGFQTHANDDQPNKSKYAFASNVLDAHSSGASNPVDVSRPSREHSSNKKEQDIGFPARTNNSTSISSLSGESVAKSTSRVPAGNSSRRASKLLKATHHRPQVSTADIEEFYEWKAARLLQQSTRDQKVGAKKKKVGSQKKSYKKSSKLPRSNGAKSVRNVNAPQGATKERVVGSIPKAMAVDELRGKSQATHVPTEQEGHPSAVSTKANTQSSKSLTPRVSTHQDEQTISSKRKQNTLSVSHKKEAPTQTKTQKRNN